MRSITKLLFVILIHTTLITPSLQAANSSDATKPASSPMIVQFTPPPGWGAADPSLLPSSVKAMVIGTSKGPFPPSISLGMAPYHGTVKQYLKMIKAKNDSEGSTFKDLGSVRTGAGEGSLSQVDFRDKWGDIRQMHVILQKDGMIYILTATAKKDEFSQYYKTFFDSMKSLRFSGSPLDLISEASQKEALNQRIQAITSAYNTLVLHEKKSNPFDNEDVLKQKAFNNSKFQEEHWLPFTQILDRDYVSMGDAWKSLLIESTQNDLMKKN